MRFTLQTPSSEVRTIAQRALKRVQESETFFHPPRASFDGLEMALFVGFFESCGLSEDQATKAAAVAGELVREANLS